MYGSFNRLKDKKGVTITNDFQKTLDESNRNRIHIEMYSTQNEGKSVIAKRFIRTLKNKIYKYMTSVSKSVYIDKLADIVNKYDNTYHISIKMKPVYVKLNTYIDLLTILKKLMMKILNLKLMILLEYQNTKIFYQKITLQIG